MKYIKTYKIFESHDNMPSEEEISSLFQEIIDLDMSIREVKYGYTIANFLKNENYKLEPIKSVYSEKYNTHRCICIITSGPSGMSSKTLENVISEFEFCKDRIESLYNATCELIILNTRDILVVITAK